VSRSTLSPQPKGSGPNGSKSQLRRLFGELIAESSPVKCLLDFTGQAKQNIGYVLAGEIITDIIFNLMNDM
jgi:hypothetical protein